MIFYTLLLNFFVMTHCFGMSSEESFLKAHTLYAQQQFQQALDLYQKIDNKGPDVWYNMGNCAYHLGKLAQARAYWRVAQKQSVGSALADVLYNIDVVEQELGDARLSGFDQFLLTMQRIISPIPTLLLQLLFFVGWCLLLALIVLKKRRSLVIVVLCVQIILGLLVTVKYVSVAGTIGIITQDNVTLYAGPNEHYHAISTLAESDTVTIHEVRTAWCKIEHQKLLGWVPAATLMVV